MRRKRSIGIIVRHALVEIQPGRAHTLVEEEEKKEDYSRFLVGHKSSSPATLTSTLNHSRDQQSGLILFCWSRGECCRPLPRASQRATNSLHVYATFVYHLATFFARMSPIFLHNIQGNPLNHV